MCVYSFCFCTSTEITNVIEVLDQLRVADWRGDTGPLLRQYGTTGPTLHIYVG